MKIQKGLSNSFVPFTNQKEYACVPSKNIEEDKVKNKTNKYMLAGAIAIATSVVAAIAMCKKGGSTLSKIDFNSGKAFAKDGEKFTGTIQDKLKKADRSLIHYKEGVVESSDKKDVLRPQLLERAAAEKDALQSAKDAQVGFKNVLSNINAQKATGAHFVEKKPKSEIFYDVDDAGNLKSRIVRTKNSIISEFYDDKQNLVSRTTEYPLTGDTITTSYAGSSKLIEVNKCTVGDINPGYKIYTKRGGKCFPAGRETVKHHPYSKKTVTYLENGYSKTEVFDGHKSVVTIRDTKGNIVKNYLKDLRNLGDGPIPGSESKVYASWYIEYLELCKKYNEPPRMCGITGGAGDHLYELLIKEKGPEEWKKYMDLQAYRSTYDEKAKLMMNLRNESEININDLKLSASEMSSLIMLDSESLHEITKLSKKANVPLATLIDEFKAICKSQRESGQQNVFGAICALKDKYAPTLSDGAQQAGSKYKNFYHTDNVEEFLYA